MYTKLTLELNRKHGQKVTKGLTIPKCVFMLAL